MNRYVTVLSAVLVGVAVAAAAEAGKARSVDDLRTFYQARCTACHGADGSGVDANGKRLRGSDFTDAKAMQGESDEELAKTVRKGLLFGWAMPAFGKDLSDADIALLVKDVLRKAEKGRKIAGTP